MRHRGIRGRSLFLSAWFSITQSSQDISRLALPKGAIQPLWKSLETLDPRHLWSHSQTNQHVGAGQQRSHCSPGSDRRTCQVDWVWGILYLNANGKAAPQGNRHRQGWKRHSAALSHHKPSAGRGQLPQAARSAEKEGASLWEWSIPKKIATKL